MKKKNKIIKAVIIFLLIWIGGSVASIMRNVMCNYAKRGL